MKIFVEALVIFFGTLLVAALVALGRPAQGAVGAFASPATLAGVTAQVELAPWRRWLAALGLV